MKLLIPLLILGLVACGGGGESRPTLDGMSKTPLSVRGWIADVKDGGKGGLQTPETEAARLTSLFEATTMFIEGAPFASGGVAPNGAFILLDVPSGDVTISFQAPGVPGAKVVLQNIPGNADVIIPAILLEPGGATLLQPENVIVRVPGRVDAPRATAARAIVQGRSVPVVEAPLSTFNDRRDFPARGLQPLAVYR